MNRNTKISVLLQTSQNFDQGIFRGIAAYAKERRSWSIYVEQEQQSWLSVLSEPGLSGLIVNLDSDVFAEKALRLRLPMVGLGGGGGYYNPTSGIPYVTTDNARIGQMAAEHQLDTGMRHYGYCGFPPTRNFSWTTIREKAFCQRLAASGFDCSVCCHVTFLKLRFCCVCQPICQQYYSCSHHLARESQKNMFYA